jgi:short-subunit dehydrogenase
MKKAIVVGASSGIGRELAKVLSHHEYTVGLTARRVELLQSLQEELSHPSFIKEMDVAHPTQAMQGLQELITEMQGVDLIVISAGIGHINRDLEWQPELSTIETNVSGFSAIANVAIHHFIKQGRGHLVGISSIAALRGSEVSPAYYASKAYNSNYLQGLRKKTAKLKLPITVTEIQPGLVDTAMAQGDGLFWVAPAEKAAHQIFDAIEKRKKFVYVTRRWRIIAALLKRMPDSVYNKL